MVDRSVTSTSPRSSIASSWPRPTPTRGGRTPTPRCTARSANSAGRRRRPPSRSSPGTAARSFGDVLGRTAPLAVGPLHRGHSSLPAHRWAVHRPGWRRSLDASPARDRDLPLVTTGQGTRADYGAAVVPTGDPQRLSELEQPERRATVLRCVGRVVLGDHRAGHPVLRAPAGGRVDRRDRGDGGRRSGARRRRRGVAARRRQPFQPAATARRRGGGDDRRAGGRRVRQHLLEHLPARIRAPSPSTSIASVPCTSP